MNKKIEGEMKEDGEIEEKKEKIKEKEKGIMKERIEKKEVMVWWGKKDNGGVRDEVVERVERSVLEGMGMIVIN